MPDARARAADASVRLNALPPTSPAPSLFSPQLLQKGAKGLHDRDQLMDVAFNGLGSMSHRVVDVRASALPPRRPLLSVSVLQRGVGMVVWSELRADERTLCCVFRISLRSCTE